MTPVKTVSQVFEAIQRAKAGAQAFCTNFFPVQAKVQSWIDHGELLVEARDGMVLFLRKDRGFGHWYFCAASPASLERELSVLPGIKTEPLVVDLVGNETALGELAAALGPAGFRPYTRLQRMARPSQSGLPQSPGDNPPVVCADKGDREAILDMLDRSFDFYADQLPMPYEIETAIDNRQMLAIKHAGALAALLFFETQGFTSTLRYWAVAEPFRSRRYGSALMHHYFAIHSGVRRFILWVVADNKNAVQKYQHYGYAPDGLVDLVLVNELIHP
jgi:hypothetical protein